MPHATLPERRSGGLGGDITVVATLVAIAGIAAFTMLEIRGGQPHGVGHVEQVGVTPNGCPITYADLGDRGDAFVLICPKGVRP